MSDENKESIDPKESMALTKVSGLNERYNNLTVNGAVVIDSQEKADMAGELIAEYSTAEKFIDGLWRDEATMAHQLHISLTGKIAKYAGPTKTKVETLRRACRAWLEAVRAKEEAEERRRQEEARKREEEQAKAGTAMFGPADQAEIEDDEEFVPSVFGAPPPIYPKAQIAGINARDSYEVETFDLMKLVKAVAAGAAPISSIQPNERFLNECATETQYKLAKEGKRGKVKVKLLYPGVEIKKGIRLARNPRR